MRHPNPNHDELYDLQDIAVEVHDATEEDGILILNADTTTIIEHAPDLLNGDTLLWDPPYDDQALTELLVGWPGHYDDLLAFTDPAHLGELVTLVDRPLDYLFVWDTGAPYNLDPHRPLLKSKLAAWWTHRGDRTVYNRDGYLYGEAPAARRHPGTTYDPAEGRRLAEVYTQSLRWLHHPEKHSARDAPRFKTRRKEALRHAKPDEWVTALLANCTTGHIVDPFMGSGVGARAAQRLGRPYLGIELNTDTYTYALDHLDPDPYDEPDIAGQEALDL